MVVGESTRAPITSPNWIQLPFTKKPGNYINAADAVYALIEVRCLIFL